jgi:hypothetical protein
MNVDAPVRDAVTLGLRVHFDRHGDTAYLSDLHRAAATLRSAGLDLQAGWTMHEAVDVAWGNLEDIRACTDAAIADYRRVLEKASPTSPVALAAPKALALEIGSDIGDRFADPQSRMAAYRAVEEELAQQLMAAGRDAPERASYLVRGLEAVSEVSRTLGRFGSRA